VLRLLEAGTIRVVARDLTEPSPLALEVLSARPYAYLDDAPLEERRTQAVMSRRWLDPQSADDLGRLDAEAITRVRTEAWPDAASPDELHDALLWLGFVTDAEVEGNPAWRGFIEALAADGRVQHLSAPRLWYATERADLFADVEGEEADKALIEIVRGRLEGLGPVTVAELAASLSLSSARIDAALAKLQAEGFALRGRFTPGTTVEEWCERRLLARIHRYTVKRLRAEIEPVQARDFARFLFEWQRVTSESRMQGPDAVAHVLGQLEGFEAPAGAWETELLPARINEYEPQWLDEHCRAGRFVWMRLASRGGDPERGAAPVRATPIALIARRNVRQWAALAQAPDPAHLTDRARAVAELLEAQGASFFDDIVEGARLLPAQVEDALAELVALGLVNSDSFNGLRALLVPADKRRRPSGARRGRRIALYGMADSGRWALVRRAVPAERGEAVEHLVRTLLKRWGVIFWRLLTREASWLPPWRELLMCCRRLEARGDIRGGRFVAGFSGEQYATPEAIGLLRDVRRTESKVHDLALSATDPLNLLGILVPGGRLPALTANRMLYRDGLPVAVLAAGETRFLQSLDAPGQWEARGALERRHVPAALVDLA
jgi:ATP-dependent Lhr-like helicase